MEDKSTRISTSAARDARLFQILGLGKTSKHIMVDGGEVNRGFIQLLACIPSARGIVVIDCGRMLQTLRVLSSLQRH